jgi:hypothetical protein
MSILLVFPAAAAADRIRQDVDFVDPGHDNELVDLGPVEPSAAIQHLARFRLVCIRTWKGDLVRDHVDEDQVVSLDYFRASLDGGGPPADDSASSVAFPPVPGAWPDDGQVCGLPLPRLRADEPSSIGFTAPSDPGRHRVDVKFQEAFTPSGSDDSSDIQGGPRSQVSLVFHVVADDVQHLARFDTRRVKALVHVRELDGSRARLVVAFRRAPRSRYRVVGASVPCGTAYDKGVRVWSDGGKVKAGVWKLTVPVAGPLDQTASIRVRAQASETCRNIVDLQAAGRPFTSPVRSISRFDHWSGRGLLSLSDLGNGNGRVLVAWKRAPSGPYRLVGSDRSCWQAHIPEARIWSRKALGRRSWKYDVALARALERQSSVRLFLGRRQVGCANTTLLRSAD